MTDMSEVKFKKVIRDGKLVKKVQCKPGFKAEDGKCVRITASEKKVRAKAARKAAKHRKGHAGSAKRAQKISLRIRKSKGL